MRFRRFISLPVGPTAAFTILFLSLDALAKAVQPWFVGLDQLVPRYQIGLLIIGTIAFGVYRIVSVHPAYKVDYLDWLKSTPWTPGMALPLGPIRLVWQDSAMLLLLLGLLAYINQLDTWIEYLITFFIAYSLFLAIALFRTGETRFGWAILFGFGLILIISSVWAILSLLIALYILGQIGLARSMRHYPWTLQKILIPIEQNLASNKPDQKLGWPYNQLIISNSDDCFSWETGIGLGLLPAWYAFVVCRLMDPKEVVDFLRFAPKFVAVSFSFFRLLIYLPGYAPPISVLGRIATGRWIIPEYDIVFAAPILATIGSLAVPQLLNLAGVSIYIAGPITLAFVLLLLFNGGPQLAIWRLTGSHRLVPSVNRQTLTQL